MTLAAAVRTPRAGYGNATPARLEARRKARRTLQDTRMWLSREAFDARRAAEDEYRDRLRFALEATR